MYPDLTGLMNAGKELSELKASMRKTGKAMISPDIKKELSNSGIIAEGFPEKGVSFIRKRSGDHTLYFVTNLSSSGCSGWVAMSIMAGSIEIYNPINGRKGLAEIRPGKLGTDIYLQLAPGESRILTCMPDQSDLQSWTYSDPDDTQTIRFLKNGF